MCAAAGSLSLLFRKNAQEKEDLGKVGKGKPPAVLVTDFLKLLLLAPHVSGSVRLDQ